MAETYTYTGEVIDKRDLQTFSGGFQKQDLIVSNDPSAQYPDTVPFTFMKDDVSKLDKVEVGDKVSISFDVQGRYWDKGDRYFVTLRAWRMAVLESGPKAQQHQEESEPPFDEMQKSFGPSDGESVNDDDIPF